LTFFELTQPDRTDRGKAEHTAEPGKKNIKDTYSWELILMLWEDIISTFQLPQKRLRNVLSIT